MVQAKLLSKRLFLLIAVILIALATYFLFSGYQKSYRLNSDIDSLSKYLHRSVLESGMFVYKIPSKQSNSLDYNILRHSGTIYSMASSQESFSIKEIQPAIEFLLNESIAPVEGVEGVSAVWSIPGVNSPKKKPQAKLGGTALAIVALEVLPNASDYSTVVEQLGSFLAFMQKSDGSFYSKYFPGEVGRSDDWVSLYYPGEAALAFGYLYERTKKEKWYNHLESALLYLARSRAESNEYIKDHWSLIATAKYFEFAPENSLERRMIYEHALRVSKVMLSEQVTSDPVNPFLVGGFSNNGTITPSATTLEGLIAVFPFIDEADLDKQELYKSIELGISYIRTGIIREGENKGGVTRAIAGFDEAYEGAEEHNRRVREIRIDYVQHVLSALLGYRDLDFKD